MTWKEDGRHLSKCKGEAALTFLPNTVDRAGDCPWLPATKRSSYFWKERIGMINVGVVGCGKIAQVRHLPEYNANPLANIAGIYDLDKSRAEENAKKYHTKVYPTYDAMLKDSMIDAVSICTANVSHCEIYAKNRWL